MSKVKPRNLREGPDKFVRIAKKLFVAVSVVVLPAIMIMLALAINLEGGAQIGYSIAVAVVALGYFVLYGYYAMQISMGTVIGLEITDKVVHLTTKRKTFTYDVKMGCVDVKVKRSKFVCTFRTQDSQDKFIFYRHAPFSKYSDSQFTEDDVRKFFPKYDELWDEED